MFPPVNQSVLDANPQFKQLYKQLTSSKLNPDGSSPSAIIQPAQSALEEQWRNRQYKAAESSIIRQSLGQVSSHIKELPEELQESIEIVTARLNSQCSSEERQLLDNDLDSFLERLRPIARSISLHLSEVAFQLMRAAYPHETKDPTLRSLLNTCPQQIALRRKQLYEAQEKVAAERLYLAATACIVLETQKDLMEAIIRVLEQTKYGSIARGTKAHADHLAIVAESMEAKLRVMKHETIAEVYSPSVRSALANYEEHLHDTMMRLQQQGKTANESLARYHRVGPEMDEIAAKYNCILKETEAVKGDIRRLGGEP
ncbi:MAG: hypothetical protein M1835_003887 [Candelina submexicana]|nr:MAG: hypothetical protein M1835_003887 [Candelina submexicana]